MRKSKITVTYIFLSILIIIFFSIVVRTVTRQVLVKRMGIDNVFTKIVLFDNWVMQAPESTNLASDNVVDNVDICWEERYPFDTDNTLDNDGKKDDTYRGLERRVASIKQNIDYYTSEFLPAYDEIIKANQLYKRAISWKIVPNTDEVNILTMNNGCLTYSAPLRSPSEITEIAYSVADFNSFCNEEKIGFYYINAGSKVDPDNKCLDSSVSFMENTNENADNLLKALDDEGVKTIDMRTLMKNDGLDWYKSFYITDHHWTNRTGLWAAGKIAETLNDKNGFEYDLSVFNEDSYDIDSYKNFWYGVQAVGVKLLDCQKEEYDTILPKFDTSFVVDIPSKNYHAEGDYKDTLYNENLLEEIKKYTDRDFLNKIGPYGLVRWQNDALGSIVNRNSNNSDKKVLLIQDSFGWYSATFLACDTGEVDMIYPESFTGSIREYIRQTRPDVVLLMYCEQDIEPINWNTHDSFFDLR